MNLDLAQLRYRAASKMSLCAGHHEIHRAEDGSEVWVECDKRELDRMTIDARVERGLDVSDRIAFFVRDVMYGHEQDVVGDVVIELLNELEQTRHRMFQVALAVSDPGKDHVDRCVDVGNLVGSAESWR